ncbi:MAG: hypothetical protein L3J68_01865 [Thermoplasmata archaeon]|jgi:hypothetical protein|nr:hypothetical protein [Thermoplasmata archaeon]
MAPEAGPPDEEALLEQLRLAVAQAAGRPREIEVGIALSIALGRRRPSVSCGGCKNPLDFEGIPARTNARLREPFRLVLDGPTGS